MRRSRSCRKAALSRAPGRKQFGWGQGSHVDAADRAEDRPDSFPLACVKQLVAANPSVRLSFAASLATHLAIVVIALATLRSTSPPQPLAPARPDEVVHLVWSSERGPGGGGGGGGNRQPEPAQKLRLTGGDATSVPAGEPRTIALQTSPVVPEPIRPLAIPAVSLASATEWLPGSIDAPPAPATGSLGSGGPDGAGSGKGGGDGPGRGPGLRSGLGGGVGGDVFRPGNGVSMPVEIRKGMPQYTADAVRARVQGSIFVDCVVQPTGSCTNIQVKHSFRPAFGLDEEAIKAAAQWRFRPGLREGQPVPVLVTLEIMFTIR